MTVVVALIIAFVFQNLLYWD